MALAITAGNSKAKDLVWEKEKWCTQEESNSQPTDP